MAPTDDKELARIHLSDSTSGATVTQTESTGSVSLTPPDSIVVQYSPDEIVQLVVMEDTLLLKLQTLHDRGTDLTWATTALGVGITLGVTVLTSRSFLVMAPNCLETRALSQRGVLYKLSSRVEGSGTAKNS